MKSVIGILILLALAACDTYTAAPYSISADNNVALKSTLGNQHVGVGKFTAASKIDLNCRLVGPIAIADGMSPEDYIRKAFADELKVAGLYDEKAQIALSGLIDDLKFSSTAGTWDTALVVNSSNGKSITVTDRYDFHTGFVGDIACHNVADAFQPAVQSLIGKVIAAPEFRSLVQY